MLVKMNTAFLFLLFTSLILLAKSDLQHAFGENREDLIVLVPRGEDPKTTKNRVIIPQVKNGDPLPPLPCLIADSGIYENGQTFTKGNFHYNCKNGTAEVIACVADDMSVIQIGRTFLKDGMRHKCQVKGETVTYEQSFFDRDIEKGNSLIAESTCYENGVHYDIGETFRNGSFQLVCKENGVAVLGCFFLNSIKEEVILLGESRILGNKKHSCEVTETGKIRYAINLIGCRNGSEEYRPGQIWTDQHIRYQCTPEGETRVLGCVDELGLFIELGHDILMGGTVHRCYKVNRTTYYHRFQCENEHSLTDCIHSNYVPKQQEENGLAKN